jgi:hypothetical protein
VRIWNMRVESADAVVDGLLDPDGAVSSAANDRAATDDPADTAHRELAS